MAAATIPSQTSGSDSIQSLFASEAHRIGTDTYRYSLENSPWAHIIKRDTFPNGMGSSIATLNYERSMAGTTNGKGTWADHVSHGYSSAPAGNVPPDISSNPSRGLPPVTVVQMAQRLREYNLRWTAVESMRIDVRDAAFSFQWNTQMSNIMEALVESGDRVWSYRTREEYFRLCDNKVLVGKPESGSLNSLANLSVSQATNFDTIGNFTLAQLNGTGGGTPSATVINANHSVLTGGVLREIYSRSSRNGAGKNSGGRSDGAPVYYLMTSPESSDYLIREPGTRSDARYGDAGELLKPLGVTRSWMGFSHVIDHEVPRFTLAVSSAGGDSYTFTEVLPWTYQAGSVSTAVASATATNAAAGTAILTVTSTAGIVAGQIVRISPSSASDEEWSGEFKVRSIISTTTLSVELNSAFSGATFTDTFAGTLYTNTNGQGLWVENADYLTAPYEMSFVMHPDVMKALVRSTPATLGAGTEFDPQTGTGEFKWLNIRNEDYNPDGTFGYFRGILEFASKPGKTAYGWSIMHRRADPVYLAAPSVTITSGLGLTA